MSTRENIEFRRFADGELLSATAAAEIVSLARDVLARQDRFSLVLAGGNTPRQLYRKLAEIPDFPWQRTHLFWGDERCVPPDAEGSNFRMVRETLLEHITIPTGNIHRMPGELLPEEGAGAYEKVLRTYFTGVEPVFECVLLGMGGDGHTASLFPGEQALEERQRLVTVARPGTASPPVPRLTLTLPVLNSSGTVFFLVIGEGKFSVVERIEAGLQDAAKQYPAARVNGPNRVLWFISP